MGLPLGMLTWGGIRADKGKEIGHGLDGFLRIFLIRFDPFDPSNPWPIS
jgi:hypothetical protein